MNQSKISVRYAKALFLAALEAKALDKVMDDITLVMKLHGIDRFEEMIESPVLKTSEKKTIIHLLLTGKASDLTLKFLTMLIENRRESFLPAISRNFFLLYKESRGIKNAELTISGKFDEKYLKSFKDILKKVYKAEIEIETKIKPEIIGGFILKVEDEQFDASVASYLQRIKKELLETSSEK